jgi:ribosome maturation protein Sdo1
LVCFGDGADRWCDRHGKQGVLNTASNSQLENEFGTKKEEDVVKQILEKGDVQSTEVSSTLYYLSSTSSAYHELFTNECRTRNARATQTIARVLCKLTKRLRIDMRILGVGVRDGW